MLAVAISIFLLVRVDLHRGALYTTSKSVRVRSSASQTTCARMTYRCTALGGDTLLALWSASGLGGRLARGTATLGGFLSRRCERFFSVTAVIGSRVGSGSGSSSGGDNNVEALHARQLETFREIRALSLEA